MYTADETALTDCYVKVVHLMYGKYSEYWVTKPNTEYMIYERSKQHQPWESAVSSQSLTCDQLK